MLIRQIRKEGRKVCHCQETGYLAPQNLYKEVQVSVRFYYPLWEKIMSYVGTGREQRNAEDRGRRTHHFTALLADSSGFLAENRAVVMPIKIIGSAHSSGRGHPSQEPIYKIAQRSRLNHTFMIHLPKKSIMEIGSHGTCYGYTQFLCPWYREHVWRCADTGIQ